ncbi:hypothetical protein RAD15_24980 [Bradyrhizobium sp. 14AA]
MSRQWGASLRGHEFDLQDWCDELKLPYDPWIEVRGGDTILRSSSFDGLAEADEVRSRAVAHIDRLNAAMFVMRRSRPIQLGDVVEFAADGKLHRTVFLEGRIDGRSRVHGAAVRITGPDGKPAPPPPPEPSEVQNWAAIADTDDYLEDALIYFGRVSAPDNPHPPTFWFDIYKALESLMDRSGGEARFLALAWAPREDVKQLKQTASWARHARRKFKKPSPATGEQDAKDLMARLLRRAFATSP